MSSSSVIDIRERLQQSHTALKDYFSPAKRQDGVGNPAQLVLFAEHAAKNGCSEIAQDCVQLYFSLNPPVNQFFVRAHLCEALACSPSNSAEEEKLSFSLSSVLKAVSIAKKSECYHFLVYNSSVVLWQICRPFQRPGSRRQYTKPLQTVVKALEECKDQDIAWRLDLLIGLVLSQLDAGQSEEAAKTCTTAIQLARKKAPEKMVELLRLHVSYNLGDSKVFDRESKSSSEYSALIRLYKIKCAIVQQKLCGSELEQRLRKVFVFIVSGEGSSSSGRKTASQSSTPPPPSDTRPPLLVELGSIAIENGLVTLTQDCLDAIPSELHSVALVIKKRVLVCQVMVGDTDDYSREAVENRQRALSSLEELLNSAIRSNDMDLIQQVCIVLWNISLPLLQANLRHSLLKPLSSTARALEQIDSLLYQMRVGLHFELAKICSDQGQLQAALDHLEKASYLDCNGDYCEQISVFKNKVSLRSEIYHTPEETLLQAIKIIEQAGSAPSGSDEMRSLLIKAGDLLAPVYFSLTLTRSDVTSNKAAGVAEMNPEVILEEKAKMMSAYLTTQEHVEEHMRTMDKREDRQRCRVWSDLAKTARKQLIWDVATSAALFCLAYDDGRWAGSVPKQDSILSERLSSPRLNQRGSPKPALIIPKRPSSTLLQKTDSQATTGKSTSAQSVCGVEREECDLVRTLANTHCLLAECYVYYLQKESLQLGEQPVPSLLGLAQSLTDNSEHWKAYTQWTSHISDDIIKGFLRGAELGCLLGEGWIVASSAAYLWNYNHHWIERGRLTEVVKVFRSLLDFMRRVAMSSEAIVLTRISSALVGGLVQKWTPKPMEATGRTSAVTGGGKKGGGGRADSRAAKKVKGGDDQLHVDPESGPDLKEALEVCEYCLGMSGEVPLSVMGALLAGWVDCKQLLRQPFPNKTFGIEDSGEPCAANSRAMVAMEMISRLGNGIWDFPNCPTLNEVSTMLSECVWSEWLVELELWVRLAELAMKQKDYTLVCQCTSKVIELNTSIKLPREKVGCELLCLAYSLQGQALYVTAAGNLAVIRRALEAFLECVRFGHEASSYNLVLEGCRQYWLTCEPLTSDPMERDLLRDPLSELLHLSVSLMGGRGGSKTEEPTGRVRDYTLVTAMYSTVFQSYMDKCYWDEGLTAVEDALWVTPKPIHKHLANYKLIFKSRMGKSVEGDMIRFQEEPSEFVAALWYKAATNASNPTETIRAYQNAIDTLQPSDGPWLKVEYLLEFSEWMYRQHFPLSDPINQLEKITEILMNIRKDETEDTMSSSCTLTGVRQLEVLIRLHVMMALLYGRGTSEHCQMSLVAVGFCLSLWKQLVGNTVSSSVPSSVEDWAAYTLPVQLCEQIRAGTGERGLNKDTVSKPMLTLHYLSELVESLSFCGLHPLTLPVLNLQLVIADCLVDNSKSLCQLLHMRLSSVCSDLCLPMASSTHSTCVGPQILDPDDLARAQVQVEQYKAKKSAVEKEESKRSISGKPSLIKSKLKSSKSLTKKESSTSKVSPPPVYCVEECLFVREVWVKEAEILIQEGQYQTARDLLNQALITSQVFDDQHTLLQVHLLFAALTLAEKYYQDAIRHLTQAQKFSAPIGDWLEGMLLLSSVINSSSDYRDQLKPVLEHAMTLLDQLGENDSPRVQHALVTLKARLTLCTLRDMVEGVSGSSTIIMPTVRALDDSLTVSAKALLDLGYHRDAAHLSTQHAALLRTLAHSKLTDDMEQFKECLLEAVSVCDRAVSALQSVCEQAIIICQPSKEMCLPVQRELIKSQSLLADILLDMFTHHSIETRKDRNSMKEKSSVEKLIEDFVREQPVLSLVQEEWQNTVKLGLERSLALLSSAHTLAGSDTVLKTKVTSSLGRCLHLLSTHTRPDSALQWSREHTMSADLSDPEGDSPQVEGNPPQALSGAKYGALSSVMRVKEAERAECDESSSLLYLSHASHTLVEAVSTSISNGQLVSGMEAALELVNCCGGFDMATSSLYLALYQSLAVSQEMSDLLRRVLHDPSGSKLGALLEQNKHLLSSKSPLMEFNTQELKTFEAYKMLQVSDNHMDLLKQLPSHFRFVVLQHSPDRSRLYASYLVPPQPPPPAPKKGQPPPPVECLDPVVSCVDVSSKELDCVLEIVRDFQTDNYQRLLKSNSPQSKTVSDSSLFEDVLVTMEVYLKQAMAPIEEAFRREKSDREISVVLLADSLLLQLPLEALEVLKSKNIISVARDFSLQVLCHRIEKFTADDSIPQAESSKDTKKKGDKYQPQPPTLLANVTNFKYVVDPRKEFESHTACCEILDQIQKYAKLTSKWSGYCVGEQVMSISEWTSLLKESSGLIFFGTENLLAHLVPTNLAPLSLQDCSMAVVMDRVHTVQSTLYQSKLDYHKSPSERCYEHPIETAMLLSLVGVRCVMGNQWDTSVQNNQDNITSLLKGLLSDGNTIGGLNWVRVKDSLPSTTIIDSQEKVDGGSQASLKDGDEKSTDALNDTATIEEDENIDFSSIYNCVLYGLPHINLLAPST